MERIKPGNKKIRVVKNAKTTGVITQNVGLKYVNYFIINWLRFESPCKKKNYKNPFVIFKHIKLFSHVMDMSLNQVIYYILIVDDDKDDHFFLRKAINQVIPQAIVESLYDGMEALKFLGTCTALPNLIFLDLNMVLVSGIDTIKKIRNNENLEKVPIVVLTTSKSVTEKEETLKWGANDFFTKPDHPKDLVPIVEAVMEKFLLKV